MSFFDLIDDIGEVFEEAIGVRIPKIKVKSRMKPLKQKAPVKEMPRQHTRHFKNVPGKKN